MDKIQALISGFLVRQNNKKLKDDMTKIILLDLLNNYINNYIFLNNINLKLKQKKCRHENFPSHISENIAKFAIYKKYKIMPTWYCKPGDLQILNKKIEVKGFSSFGPSSFGPTEKWDILCFVDCTRFLEKIFKVYLINLSNINPFWYNIKINNLLTYKNIVESNSRGQLRKDFNSIYVQIPEQYKSLIFDGYFDEL